MIVLPLTVVVLIVIDVSEEGTDTSPIFFVRGMTVAMVLPFLTVWEVT